MTLRGTRRLRLPRAAVQGGRGGRRHLGPLTAASGRSVGATTGRGARGPLGRGRPALAHLRQRVAARRDDERRAAHTCRRPGWGPAAGRARDPAPCSTRRSGGAGVAQESEGKRRVSTPHLRRSRRPAPERRASDAGAGAPSRSSHDTERTARRPTPRCRGWGVSTVKDAGRAGATRSQRSSGPTTWRKSLVTKRWRMGDGGTPQHVRSSSARIDEKIPRVPPPGGPDGRGAGADGQGGQVALGTSTTTGMPSPVPEHHSALRRK